MSHHGPWTLCATALRVFVDPMQRTRNRRWVALDADGNHIALGCHSDPSETNIARLEAELGRQGIGDVWLAVAEGDDRKPRMKMSLLMVWTYPGFVEC
jgi:hypothetical protein